MFPLNGNKTKSVAARVQEITNDPEILVLISLMPYPNFDPK